MHTDTYYSNAAKLAVGQQVVVEFRRSVDHPYELALAMVCEAGRWAIHGCIPSVGMVGEVRSRPLRFGTVQYARHFRAGDIEYDVMLDQDTCILGDGSILYRVNDNGSMYWVDPRAPGNDKRVDLLAHAVAVTPA